MREKRFILNTVISLGYQIASLICGFILPRAILFYVGSKTNGLVSSITQCLSFISFLEFGVGAVVQSALYKPLANRDEIQISKIIKSANNFFSKIAKILCVYIVILIFIYPYVVDYDYGFIFTATLICVISISYFAQYFFGLVDQLLLNASQRGYVQYTMQMISVVMNTVVCIVIMKFGGTIHAVKFATAIIYLLRPIVYRLYIRKNYKIDYKIKYTEEPIPQKWNGVAQHISSVVLTGTDTIVLTVFSTLENVSVYNVYYLVISSVQNAMTALNSGFHALIGELWAKQELDKLNSAFGRMEWFIHTIVTFIFGATLVLIVPFVRVYTSGINDTEYIQPLFAVLITFAYAAKCLSIPYHAMILATGQYKQTQAYFVITAVLNVAISIITVFKYGLIGVAIGTLIAMFFQVQWMAIYVIKQLGIWSGLSTLKQLLADVIIFGIGLACTYGLKISEVTYVGWFGLAIKTCVMWVIICIVVNLVFYKKNTVRLIERLRFRKHVNDR